MKCYRIEIPPYELGKINIPSGLTQEQLEDSGYTYRFIEHKRLIQERLGEENIKNIKFTIREIPRCVEIIGCTK